MAIWTALIAFLVCPMRPNDIVGRGTKRHLDERCVGH